MYYDERAQVIKLLRTSITIFIFIIIIAQTSSTYICFLYV